MACIFIYHQQSINYTSFFDVYVNQIFSQYQFLIHLSTCRELKVSSRYEADMLENHPARIIEFLEFGISLRKSWTAK